MLDWTTRQAFISLREHLLPLLPTTFSKACFPCHTLVCPAKVRISSYVMVDATLPRYGMCQIMHEMPAMVIYGTVM